MRQPATSRPSDVIAAETVNNLQAAREELTAIQEELGREDKWKA